jgi:hypothetical protein
MATRILGPTGSRRRRRFLIVPILIVACTALFLIGSAQAVHDLEFQLDGNALSNLCGTTPDGGPAGPNACTVQQIDWGRTGTTNTHYIFNADRSVNTSIVDPNNSPGFTNAAFQRDFGVRVSAQDTCSLTNTTSTTFCTADTTTFATGSKDIQNISGGGADQAGNWQCNRDNNVTNKGDIMNAYSAAYAASNGDKIIYFALEKSSPNGSNNVGFWFLQGDANCVSAGSAQDFTGTHRNGDILVTSAFSIGGGVSTIQVFRWKGGANGCIDSDPAAGPNCDNLPIGSGGDCKTAPTTPPPAPVDTMCATTNSGTLATNTSIQVPWLTFDSSLGVGNTVQPPDFFEGAINISKAFREAPGGGTPPGCINTFIADTRSSPSPSATLYDFARGALGGCTTTVRTSRGVSDPPVTGEVAPPSDIDGGSVSSGTDTARLTITGVSSFGGTLSWYLCGPVATDGCSRTQGVHVTPDQTVSANGAYVSSTATLTSAGRYCWTAHFEPDQATSAAGVLPGDDNGANECFTVAKVTPSLTTCSGTFDASNVCTPASAVAFGNPVSDRALLSGLSKEPGSGGPSTTYPTINPTTPGVYAGSIQFTLKGPSTTGCGVTATGTGTNPQSVSVDSAVGNKVYGPVFFTPNTPGTFHWQATISNASSVNNILPVSDNANCDQAREDVVVQQIPTEIATGPFTYPQDSASIRSSAAGDLLPAGGTVVFKLFGPTSGATGLENCQANGATGLVYSETKNNVVPAGGAHEVTGINTNNQSFSIDSSKNGTYYWLVTYATGDTAHTSRQSACSESTAVTQTDSAYPGTLFTP